MISYYFHIIRERSIAASPGYQGDLTGIWYITMWYIIYNFNILSCVFYFYNYINWYNLLFNTKCYIWLQRWIIHRQYKISGWSNSDFSSPANKPAFNYICHYLLSSSLFLRALARHSDSIAVYQFDVFTCISLVVLYLCPNSVLCCGYPRPSRSLRVCVCPFFLWLGSLSSASCIVHVCALVKTCVLDCTHQTSECK